MPEGARIGIMSNACTTSDRFQNDFREYPSRSDIVWRKGAREYDDEHLRDRTILMADSGIYVDEDESKSYDELFDAYENMGADYGVSIDILKDKANTLEKARKGWRLYENEDRDFTLVGVAQGETKDEYLACYEELREIGYKHIAIGGLLKQRANTVRYSYVRDESLLENVLKAIREEFDPEWLFVLGAFHPKRIEIFQETGVWGADYKGWIFNYYKKEKLKEIIRRGEQDEYTKLEAGGLTIDEVEEMTEQQLRFYLVRTFTRKRVFEALHDVDKSAPESLPEPGGNGVASDPGVLVEKNQQHG